MRRCRREKLVIVMNTHTHTDHWRMKHSQRPEERMTRETTAKTAFNVHHGASSRRIPSQCGDTQHSRSDRALARVFLAYVCVCTRCVCAALCAPHAVKLRTVQLTRIAYANGPRRRLSYYEIYERAQRVWTSASLSSV